MQLVKEQFTLSSNRRQLTCAEFPAQSSLSVNFIRQYIARQINNQNQES